MAEVLIANSVVIFFLVVALVLTTLTLPGNMFIFLTALVYAFYDDFVRFDTNFLLLLFVGLAIGELVEFAAGAAGAKKEKASNRAIAGAVVGAFAGAIAGTALLPVLGSFAGALLGAYTASYYAELSVCRDAEKSKKVAVGVLKGQIIGAISKFVIAIAMITAIVMRLPW